MRDLVKKVKIFDFSSELWVITYDSFQIVNTSKTYTVDKEKIARLVEKYVSRYSTAAPPGDRRKK